MTANEFKNTIIPAYGAMVAVGRRYLDYDTAQDVAQDVVRLLWEKRDEIVIKDDVRAFAMRCVRNRCLDLLKKRSNHLSLEDLVSDISDETDSDHDAMYRIAMLDDAVAGLKEPTKTIMRLRLQGSSANDISKSTGLSESNVRQILSRTRKKLKELIMKKL